MTGSDKLHFDRVDATIWDEFLPSAVGATPFIGSAWMGLAAEAMGAQLELVGAFDGDQLVAGCAGVVTGSGWRQCLSTPPLLPHTGFVFRPTASARLPQIESDRSTACAGLIGHLQQRFARVHLTHAPALVDTRPFQWAHWQVTPRYTYHIDLPADRTQVWDGFERRTRTAIRKAQKGGYRVEASTDIDELRRLYAAVYGGESGAPVPAATVQQMAVAALQAGLIEGWRCVAPSGETAAVVFFARSEQTLYAWVAGADPAHRDAGATSLLYWHVLEQTPCAHFDFVGANMSSIAFFKRGFGGRLVPYAATEGFGHPLARTLAGLRRVLRGNSA